MHSEGHGHHETSTHQGSHVSTQPKARDTLVFISAAEPSADSHGADLIRAARERRADLRFVGVAGPKMAAAGCESIFDMTSHAGMLLGAVRIAGRAAKMLSTADRYLRMYPFAAAVVIDSPTLHLPLAAKAQAAGVPVMYYIAPQMWAWGAYRIHKLRNRCERVAVIFPFEEAYFRNQGVEAEWVGHPLADQVEAERPDAARVREIRAKGAPVIALLPGSRKHVVQSILPDQLQVARRIAERFPHAYFGVSVAGPNVAPIVAATVRSSQVRSEMFPSHRADLIEAADLVLVASGTTALEVAFRERPMIVMYQSSPLFYNLIARWMIRTPFLSLPNILAGEEIVPEFMPYYRSTEPIAAKAIELLENPQLRSEMTEKLAGIVAPLRGPSAARNASEMLIELVDRHP
jgi:lipid-A-disaccharide synthase